MELEAGADAIRAELLEKWKSPTRPIDAFHEAKRRPRRVWAGGAVTERRVAFGGREVTIPVNITVRIGEATLRDGEG
jgi:hypothetical protein